MSVGGDKVVKPSHYERYKIEPITFIMENDISFAMGNALKYITRAGFKRYDSLSMEESEIVDLKKAARYIEMRVNQIEGREVTATKE